MRLAIVSPQQQDKETLNSPARLALSRRYSFGLAANGAPGVCLSFTVFASVLIYSGSSLFLLANLVCPRAECGSGFGSAVDAGLGQPRRRGVPSLSPLPTRPRAPTNQLVCGAPSGPIGARSSSSRRASALVTLFAPADAPPISRLVASPELVEFHSHAADDGQVGASERLRRQEH